jgi:hypothetical protein
MDYTELEITLAMKAHNCSREEAISTWCEVIRNHRANQAIEQQKTQYQQDRKQAYPSIGDQLDALYKAGLFPADMAAKIKAVKDAYPKPE